jgi:hypothetical protein
LMFLVASNPSNWLSSSNIVRWTSESPPPLPDSPLDDPMESISSMKMSEGAFSLAITNNSRTYNSSSAAAVSARGEGTYHPGTLSNVLLHELTTTDTDELALGVVSDGPRQQRLSGPRRSVEQHTLGLSDTESVEELGVLDGQLDDFLDLLDLLVESSDHLVRRIRHLLDHHERDEWVLLRGEDRVELVCAQWGWSARVERGMGNINAQESERRATRRLGVSWDSWMVGAKSTTSAHTH